MAHPNALDFLLAELMASRLIALRNSAIAEEAQDGHVS